MMQYTNIQDSINVSLGIPKEPLSKREYIERLASVFETFNEIEITETNLYQQLDIFLSSYIRLNIDPPISLSEVIKKNILDDLDSLICIVDADIHIHKYRFDKLVPIASSLKKHTIPISRTLKKVVAESF